MNIAREWTAFGGASLALMGTELLAGARRHAEDALAWQRHAAAGSPRAGSDGGRFLIRVYRLGGAVVILLGTGLVVGAAAGLVAPSARLRFDAPRALGACVAVLGFGCAALKLSRGAARGPRFLSGDPLADRPERSLGERVAGAATWCLCALWAAFGLRLFLEGAR